jgi:hypothetical protein
MIKIVILLIIISSYSYAVQIICVKNIKVANQNVIYTYSLSYSNNNKMLLKEIYQSISTSWEKVLLDNLNCICNVEYLIAYCESDADFNGKRKILQIKQVEYKDIDSLNNNGMVKIKSETRFVRGEEPHMVFKTKDCEVIE